MKWKLTTVVVLVVLAGWVSVALHAKDKLAEDRARRLQSFPDPAFDDSSEFEGELARKSESVKDRFLRLASEYAQDGDEAELKRMADDLQTKINERDADQKVTEIQSLLQDVLEKYPQTTAGMRAKSMLDASLPAEKSAPDPPAKPEAKPATTIIAPYEEKK